MKNEIKEMLGRDATMAGSISQIHIIHINGLITCFTTTQIISYGHHWNALLDMAKF